MLARHVLLFRVRRESRFHYDVWILNDEKRDMLTPIYSILSAVHNSANLNMPAIYANVQGCIIVYNSMYTQNVISGHILLFNNKTCALKVA